MSRSYYRGAAGAVLVYDVSSHASLAALPTFLRDARALASAQLSVILAGNKCDLAEPTALLSNTLIDGPAPGSQPRATGTEGRGETGLGTQQRATTAPDGRDVAREDAARWASQSDVPVAVELSAYTGEGVEELFARLASVILTKIELGEIAPDDPHSGIQYGDSAAATAAAHAWGAGADSSAVQSGMADDIGLGSERWRTRRRRNTGGRSARFKLWDGVLRSLPTSGRRSTCC